MSLCANVPFRNPEQLIFLAGAGIDRPTALNQYLGDVMTNRFHGFLPFPPHIQRGYFQLGTSCSFEHTSDSDNGSRLYEPTPLIISLRTLSEGNIRWA